MILLPWQQLLRPHQWLKNTLLFLPLLAAHHITALALWKTLFLAFIAFSLGASAVYVINDLCDRKSDSLHPRKRYRPFAAGTLTPWNGLVLAPILLVLSLSLASLVSMPFFYWLILYVVISCLYSVALKRLVLIDCLILAALYTLRLIAGAAAVNLPLSFWLLGCSMFLFLSLAFLKRYTELCLPITSNPRGYHAADAPLLQCTGIASGYAAVIILALYLNSHTIFTLYAHPLWVWGTLPILSFWINWMWLQAHRHQMPDDPILFALQDKSSWLSGLAFFTVLGIASF